MIGVTTDLLLAASLVFFLLGATSWLVYNSFISVCDTVLSCPKALFKEKIGAVKFKELYTLIKEYSLPVEIKRLFSAVFILCVGVTYLIFNYAYLDGVIRLIPAIFFCVGLVTSNLAFKRPFEYFFRLIRLVVSYTILFPLYRISSLAYRIYIYCMKKITYFHNKAKIKHIDIKI